MLNLIYQKQGGIWYDIVLQELRSYYNKDYDGGRLSASKGNHGVAGKSSVFWM